MTELTVDDVARAADVLAGVAHRPPVLTSAALDTRASGTVLCKAENFQRTGTFKFRGAYNAIAGLSESERRHGVCTISSGNHAQAVALAARLLDVRAVVLMPADAPTVKRAATAGYGAEIRTYDRGSMPQWQAGEQLQAQTGLTLISSHDAVPISAGAGTAAMELLDDCGPLDILVAAVGGGGGLAGYATVAKARHPQTRIVAVEPAGSRLLTNSLAAGQRVEQPVADTIADGLRLSRLGALPWHVLSQTVDEVAAVTDAQIIAAMRFAFERMKIVLEPSGATALAAIHAGIVDVTGQRAGVVLTGGNVDLEVFSTLMARTSPQPEP